MSLTPKQKEGLRKQLEKENRLLQRAEDNVAEIKDRIAGLKAALGES